MMKTFLPLLCALALSLLLAACGGGSPVTLNQANLDRINEGMSPAEVKTILGSPTDSKSEPIPIVGGTKTTYVYRNEDSRVVIVFKNDTLQSKEGHFADTTRPEGAATP